MVPLLWGTRAVIQDKQGRISIIDLSGNEAKLEVLGDRAAPGAEFIPNIEGITIVDRGKELYSFNPEAKIIRGISLNLPECEINADRIRVGTATFAGNMVTGLGVGIVVSDDGGIGMGDRLPPNLARLVVR